ncbi:catalase-like [Macrosteles quadrilineatus]|uniref:catalase-like n=1 Tax=Macrosteles quadrilineatus TaxID=74068 RepID=UPI0023E1F51F|nr:catalase-like [Macrosteles quadrilineatus]
MVSDATQHRSWVRVKTDFRFQTPSETHRGTTSVCYNILPLLTTSNGAPVDDKISSLSVGPVGPLVLQDFVLLDELAHFTRERIPERVTHAKGAGAYGHFIVTNASFSNFSVASLFQGVGKKTHVFVRFSTFVQESGSCDTVRDLRGVAIKFYTDDGNWDLVGSNSPVFFIRDPILFPSFVHSQKRHPATHLHDFNMFWDFVANRPETLHQMMYLFSDRGTPDGYRHMNLHGSHTFKVVKRDGQPFYTKFHFRTDGGVRNLDAEVALALCARDPDYSIRDLYYAIANKHFPSWTMYYQLMTFEQAIEFEWNPFDVTKIWPETDYPFYEIGKLLLDINPTNYFAEVEQSAFSPSHLVPGIEPSPDKMLQGRLFAYPDAQRYRLGVNYQQLRVNAPYLVKVANTQRDGRMCHHHPGAAPNYYPNSFQNHLKVCPQAKNTRWTIYGDVARYNADDHDNYGQVTLFWNNFLNEEQRVRLVENMSIHLRNANKVIQHNESQLPSIYILIHLVDEKH